MLRKQRTDTASPRSFKRIARLAMVGVALAGLTACGGGGGGGSSTPAEKTPATPTPTPPVTTPTPPEIPITPTPTPTPTELPPPTEAELEAATVISAGENVEGSLESANDVKYYRLEVAERGEFEFTLNAEAGIELAILNSDGGVITTAVTASEAKVTVSAPQGRLYLRILDRAKRGAIRAVKTFNVASVAVAHVQNYFNLKRGIPHFRLPVGGAAFEFDYRDHITLPDGRRIVSDVSATLPGVKVSIQGTTVRLQASGETVPGGIRVTLELCIPIVNYCYLQPFQGTAFRAGRVKPEYANGVMVRVEAGVRTHVLPRLGGYFDYPAGSELSYRLQGAGRGESGFVSTGVRWHLAPSTDLLSATVATETFPVMSQAEVIAEDQHGAEANLRVSITFEEEEGGTPSGGALPPGGPESSCPAGYDHRIPTRNPDAGACPWDCLSYPGGYNPVPPSAMCLPSSTCSNISCSSK